MLKKMYETGYDLHVANYVAYLHTDKALYEDETHKTKAKKADVERPLSWAACWLWLPTRPTCPLLCWLPVWS